MPLMLFPTAAVINVTSTLRFLNITVNRTVPPLKGGGFY